MFDDEDDDEGFGFEDHLEQQANKVRSKIKAEAKKEFINGCYMAYDMLVSKGAEALESGDMTSICNAINRMMSLFLIREEYERCQFLKQFVDANIPNHEIVPDPMVNLELGE